jgi:hypothetical protein
MHESTIVNLINSINTIKKRLNNAIFGSKENQKLKLHFMENMDWKSLLLRHKKI